MDRFPVFARANLFMTLSSNYFALQRPVAGLNVFWASFTRESLYKPATKYKSARYTVINNSFHSQYGRSEESEIDCPIIAAISPRSTSQAEWRILGRLSGLGTNLTLFSIVSTQMADDLGHRIRHRFRLLPFD